MNTAQLTALAACALATEAIHQGMEELNDALQDWFDQVAAPTYLSNGSAPGYFMYSPQTLERIKDRELPALPAFNKAAE